MRILFLNPTGQPGGAEKSLLDIIAGLRRLEPHWTLHLLAGQDGPLLEKARALGAEARALPFPGRLAGFGDAGAGGPAGDQINRTAFLFGMASAASGVPLYVRRLREAIRSIAPDVIHTNGLKMHLLGAWARPAEVPMIWHIHEYVRPRPIVARLLNRLAGECAVAVANSRSVAEDLGWLWRNHVRVVPILNAVDLDAFSPRGGALDLDRLAGLAPCEPGTIRVGLPATMARWKGHEVFLRAMAMLPSELSVRGYLIGGALYQTAGSQHSLDEFRSMAARMGIAGRIGFTGFVDDAASAMRALDIVVHASTLPEPFGLVIAEAMACGRAVVVSQAGGAAELVIEGQNALAYAPGDAVALAGHIARLAADARLRVRLGTQARAFAESRFQRERLAREFAEVYQSVVKGSVKPALAAGV